MIARALRSLARSPCSAPPQIRLLYVTLRVSLAASFSESLAVVALRFARVPAIRFPEDLHLQITVHAGHTKRIRGSSLLPRLLCRVAHLKPSGPPFARLQVSSGLHETQHGRDRSPATGGEPNAAAAAPVFAARTRDDSTSSDDSTASPLNPNDSPPPARIMAPQLAAPRGGRQRSRSRTHLDLQQP